MVDRSGLVRWFVWGFVLGFGSLAIFSIGLPIVVVCLLALPWVARSKVGWGMALVGIALPWFVFSLEGLLSPDCADGSTTFGPGSKQTFRCDVMHTAGEYWPFLLASGAVILIGAIVAARSLRGGRTATEEDPLAA